MTAPQTRAIEYAGSRDVFPNPGRGFLVPYHPAQKDEILPPLPASTIRLAALWAQRKAPERLVSMTCIHSS